MILLNWMRYDLGKKKIKCLLAAVNAKFIHSSLAVRSLAASFEKYSERYSINENIDLIVKEMTINDRYDYLIYEIISEKPDIVAFSVYIWNVNIIARLCGDIRAMIPSCLVILGGPQVSFESGINKIFDNNYDYIVKGEGERSFFCILSELNIEKNFELPAHFGYKKFGKIVSCENANNLSEFPFVYSSENIRNFDNRIIYYEASRGCPFRCSYCLSALCGNVRVLPYDRVFADLDFFIRSGVKQVKFVDRTFNCNNKRAFEVISYIIKNSGDADINFHFETAPDLFSEELIELLQTAKPGLIQLEMGIQSTYDKALEACGRKSDMEKSFYNINKIILKGNINVHLDLIAGLPFEDYYTFQNSFNQVYNLNPHQLQIGFLKLLPGAFLNETAKQHGYCFSKNPPYEILRNDFIFPDEIVKLKTIEYVFDKYYNSLKFYLSLRYLRQFFKTPFDMYEHIMEFFIHMDLIYKPVAAVKLYEILFRFASENNIISDYGIFKEILLLDYHSCERSNTPPDFLKDLCFKNKYDKPKYGNNKTNTIRYINGKEYIFDYSKRDPVSGRFILRT